MKKVVMYLPWKDGSFLSQAQAYVLGAAARAHKMEKSYFVRNRGQMLNDLQPGDRLYILGHGHVKGMRNDKLPETIMSFEELVDVLKKESVPTDFDDIRLWVCQAGDWEMGDFAWDFTKKIRETHKNATVTAYTGLMTLAHTGKKLGTKYEDRKKTIEGSKAREFKVTVNETDRFKNFFS